MLSTKQVLISAFTITFAISLWVMRPDPIETVSSPAMNERAAVISSERPEQRRSSPPMESVPDTTKAGDGLRENSAENRQPAATPRKRRQPKTSAELRMEAAIAHQRQLEAEEYARQKANRTAIEQSTNGAPSD